MTMIRILVCDDLSEEGLALFRAEKNFEVVVKTKLPLADLKREIAEADGCVVRSGTQLTREVIEAAGTRLKVIGRAGVGLDNVDVDAASKKGVVVMNTPGGNTISAAEQAFCLMMAAARNVAQADASMKRGEWERKKFTGHELYGKTLGVAGLGRIGTEVAKRAQAFGMKVIAFDPFLRAEKAMQIGVEVVSFDELLAQSDFLTLHMPLTAENKHMIGAAQIAKMKKGAIVINCARGGLIDEKALAEAIKAKKLGGAGLDVFEEEPPKERAAIDLPQVVATPHLGASTEEAQVAVAVDVAQCIIEYFHGKGFRNAVNVPQVDPEILQQIQPYIRLAEKMGALQAQLMEGQIQGLDIRFAGQVAESETTPVTVAFVKGLLGSILAESVNYVNASVLAKERGIKITESKSSTPTQYANLIQADVRTDKKRYGVSGTVFSREDIRIVKIDDYDVEVVPDGFILMISNRDVPGIVGQIGTVLGKNRVNIAGMTLGRDVKGGQAKTVIKIDSAVSDEILADLRKSGDILDAKVIKL